MGEDSLSVTLGEHDGTAFALEDPYLGDFLPHFRDRFSRLKIVLREIEYKEGSLEKFSRGYEKFGFNRTSVGGSSGILYQEWAPGATRMWLIGDFNGWNRSSHPCERDAFGCWSIFLPDNDGAAAIAHNSKVKICLETESGERVDRISAWMRRVVQEESVMYDAVYWDPPEKYQWKNDVPEIPIDDLRIYEAHVGMSSEEPKVSSYREFTETVLPHIKDTGYNALQLMGIMEHGYYASFGYQVTNLFAVSSRCGTPEDLMYLIDTAHGMGMVVLLDVVHSHVSKNVDDGLNMFDGTDHCYFHGGTRGQHPVWDSRLFNYNNWEVLRFLLSNLRWWIEEYKFDGFRFDGVTSMLFTHHGIGTSFAGGYKDYFNSSDTDHDAVLYLTLANLLVHSVKTNVVTVAEDVSGMPGVCREVADGGLGFDFRLGMGLPDMWIKLMKIGDEGWDVAHITYVLTDRRHKEKTIAYCESHDQSLVGDKTLAFWLMDKDMYTEMTVLKPPNPVVDRGIALHKMIRLITCSMGGEGYLTFMGNEFGHPEWIDFPRDGNNNSYHYARRQWSLATDHLLRYHHLLAFEKAMNRAENKFKWLRAPQAYVSLKHNEDKMIVFERAALLFVFNFHPTQSFPDYRVGVEKAGKYSVVLSSDNEAFGGHKRVMDGGEYFTEQHPHNGRSNSLLVRFLSPELVVCSYSRYVKSDLCSMSRCAHLCIMRIVHHRRCHEEYSNGNVNL